MTLALTRRQLLLTTAAAAATATAGLGACSPKADAAIVPAEIDPATTCDLDGMLLADYPGPKAQIFYANQAAPTWCCDTAEMFSLLLKPEQVRPVRAVFVQDMAAANWEQPRGHWFDAKTGYYVVGSKRHGSMGPTPASFRSEADAQRFAGTYGGRVMPFAAVKPEMVDLSGGALHDTRM